MAGEPVQLPAGFSADQEQTRFLVWKRPFTHKLIEDSQDAHVFCPRRRFFLESLMQSEPDAGVRRKIYWPYWNATFGQQLFPNGGLLCVEGTSTLQSLPPCGLHAA
jgi:hypothetical protein